MKVSSTQLIQRSIEIILEYQAPSGAYVASPNFPTYHYCWFRDGSFIAYAMDLYGEHDSARRFHTWVAEAVNRRATTVQRALEKASIGRALDNEDVLHTRYTLDGKEGTTDEWQNFQLDGFGTWLWALAEHWRLGSKALPTDWLQAAGLVANYLEGLWRLPCYDCWEEFPQHVHPHTLAAIAGGLHAYGALTNDGREQSIAEIRCFLEERALKEECFVKFPGDSQVDASLLGLSTPYRAVEPGDARMVATARRIASDLCKGGVYRYQRDTYYGGGQWILLAAWLGWYYCEIGQPEKANQMRNWVENQADEHGWLPEQIPTGLNDPSYYQPWLQRWGPIANPLLWSHANYLILCKALEQYG